MCADVGDFGSIFVPTVETTRLTYFLDSLINNKHHVMFVGNTGTGKTAIMVGSTRCYPAASAAAATCLCCGPGAGASQPRGCLRVVQRP